MKKVYHVYILSNGNLKLYIGVTSRLPHRTEQHKIGSGPTAFTQRYHVWKLVYAEAYDSVHAAIDREKQLKHWCRQKKLDLIATMNPDFKQIDPN